MFSMFSPKIMGIARCLVIAVAMHCWTTPVLAGAFSIVPQKVRMTSDVKSSKVTLTNTGPETTLFQVETFTWSDGANPNQLKPTRDILAVPAVFTLEPNEKQVIRIAKRRPGQATKEETYRLLISEVPEETGTDQGVVFALRMNLPVFVIPDGALAKPRLSLNQRRNELVLSNNGTAHMVVNEVLLNDLRTRKNLLKLPVNQPGYLLAGQRMNLPLEFKPDPGDVMVVIVTPDGKIEQRLAR